LRCKRIIFPAAFLLVTGRWDNATLSGSALDYRLDTKEMRDFWKNLFSVMKIDTSQSSENSKETKQKLHNLLLNGLVD